MTTTIPAACLLGAVRIRPLTPRGAVMKRTEDIWIVANRKRGYLTFTTSTHETQRSLTSRVSQAETWQELKARGWYCTRGKLTWSDPPMPKSRSKTRAAASKARSAG